MLTQKYRLDRPFVPGKSDDSPDERKEKDGPTNPSHCLKDDGIAVSLPDVISNCEAVEIKSFGKIESQQ